MLTIAVVVHIAVATATQLANFFGWKKVASYAKKVEDVTTAINAELPAK